MKRILIVEDNAINMKLARDLLERQGYHVFEAMNADDGIVIAREEKPDLILMDVQLPGTDGLTATRLLRADTVTREIPIVALTAHAMRGDEERILAAGCDRYVAKPIRYKEFLAVIAELIESGSPQNV